MNQEEKKLLLRMNKRIQRWKKAGAESFAISEVKNMLLNFYLKHDIKAPELLTFTTRKDLTKDQESELLRIAESMEAMKQTNVGYYKRKSEKMDVDTATMKSYETFRKNHPLSTPDFASWVQMRDTLEQEQHGFKEYYDSKTLIDVYEYGYSLNLRTEEIQTLLKKQIRYGKNKPYEQRYDATISRINKYYKQYYKE